MGGGVCVGGGVHPPDKWSSRSQTKCSRSQNYAFVCMQCFAKQIKYSCETRDWVGNLLKWIKQLRNNMKKYYVLISRVYERIISQNTHKGMKFPFTFQTWRYLYVTAQITCWHFYLEFRFCKVIHGWYSILAKISNPPNQTPKCDESRSK